MGGPGTFPPPPPAITQSGFRQGSLPPRHCSFVFSSLPPLFRSLRSFSHPRPLFSIVCRLFSQNTGGGGPRPSQRPQTTSHRPRPPPPARGRLTHQWSPRATKCPPRPDAPPRGPRPPPLS